MKKFKKLEKHRWFIWTIVIVVVILVGLATYIYYLANDDSSWAVDTSTSHHRVNNNRY